MRPMLIAAIIAARCEIDLSPGTLIVPWTSRAGISFTAFILARRPAVCLDSNRCKPLTYSENTVPNTIKFKLPSRIESVDEAAAKADGFAREAGLGDEQIFAIDLAIRESVANAVKHGNKLNEEKPVEVELSVEGGTLEISVRDFGDGFSPEQIPDPTDAENLLKANGRGILFMRTFMDHVEWSHPPGGGTVTKMVKNIENLD